MRVFRLLDARSLAQVTSAGLVEAVSHCDAMGGGVRLRRRKKNVVASGRRGSGALLYRSDSIEPRIHRASWMSLHAGGEGEIRRASWMSLQV